MTQFLSHRSVRQSLRRCKPHLGIDPLALLGLTGIDYASNEQQYTLRFPLGESFNGL